jgi:outer membrane protein assembly factor BamB
MPSTTRRAFLVSLGVGATAGCLDDARGTDESPTGSERPPTTAGTSTEPEQSERATPSPPDSVDSTWPVPGADAGFSNSTRATGPTGQVGELWRFVDDADLSTPIVADGTAYVGTVDGDVVALDARSGGKAWRQTVGETAFAPRVVDGTLYVPTDAGIVALASDGTERWRIDTPTRDDSTDDEALPPRVSVLATDDGLYWFDGGDGDEQPAVVATTLDDGSERWRTEIGEPRTRRLFAGADTVFVPNGTNGQHAWRLAADDGEVLAEPDRGYDFPAERLFRNGSVYSTEPFFGGASASPIAEDGYEWNDDAPPGTHHVSAGPDRLYVGVERGDEPGLYALSASDGSEEWTAEITPTHRPVVAGEAVLVHDEDTLYCLDPGDGTERWRRSNETVGVRMAVADDVLFVTRGDTLRAFRPR